MAISFTRLRNGSWGLRVTNQTNQTVHSGNLVNVPRRNGGSSNVVVGVRVYRNTRTGLSLWTIATPAPAESSVPDYIPPETAAAAHRADAAQNGSYDELEPATAYDDASPEAVVVAAETIPESRGVISSNLLHWDANTRTFSAEESTVREHREEMGRVSIRSARTGAVMDFVLVHTDKDREGEVTGWEYANADRTIKLVLFND